MGYKIFSFGKPVHGDNFIGRENEQERLSNNLKHGINSIILSPRKWGKTSLVLKVLEQIRSEVLNTVMVDVYCCKNQNDFCERIVSAVIRQTSSSPEEIAKLSQTAFCKTSLNHSSSNASYLEEILSIPEKIAEKKSCHIIVCIDEFQQVAEFEGSISFQEIIKRMWQHQKNVTYCLCACENQQKENLFNDENKPLFRFGDIIDLGEIPLNVWTPYIQGQFAKEGKSISEKICKDLCEKADYNPYSIQQLSWILMLYTAKIASEIELDKAVDNMAVQNCTTF